MKRFCLPVLVLSGVLVITACGSTVTDRVAQDGAGQAGTFAGEGAGELGETGVPGEMGVPGETTQGRLPGVPGAVGGVPSNGGRPDAQPGEVGDSPGGALEPGGPQVVTPGTTTKQPIQIGVLITDTDSFKKTSGVGASFTTLTRDSVHAYIKAINAAGGVAGRKLTVVDATFNYTAANYDNEFQAVCEKFTKDNHVGAVIYDAIAYNQNFNTCLTQAGVPAFYMGQAGTQVGDSTEFANHPGLITAGSVSIDRRLQSILNRAIAGGFLRSGSKLGVIVETCPYNVRAYDRTLVPILARNKITVVRQDVDCGQGSADHGTGIGAVQSAVLRYKGEGVDSVMFDTLYENGVVYYFAQAAQAQDYTPQYLLFHQQGCPECMAAFPREQLVKMRGFGGSPLWDVTHPPPPPVAQAAARRNCLETVKSQGVTGSGIEQYFIFDSCDAVALLHRALTLSGGQAGTRHLVPAVDRLGTDYVSTMTLNGATRFGPGRHDGMELTAVSVYQTKCECFAYITPAGAIP